MGLTRAQLRTRVYRDLPAGKESANNTRLTQAEVDSALLLGEQEFCRRTRCFRRTATINAVDEQAAYAFPGDIVALEHDGVKYKTTRLTYLEERTLARYDAEWRDADAGTPTHWLAYAARQFSLYPPPDVTDEVLALDGYYIPFAIGNSITALARSSNVVTITTSTPHGLRVGESVTVSGCGTASFNAAYTVASVTSTTVFTAAQTGTDATVSSTYGYLSYTGGALPMLADTDVSVIHDLYQLAIAHYAVYWLATNQLVSDPIADAAGQRAAGKFDELIARHEEDRWIG